MTRYNNGTKYVALILFLALPLAHQSIIAKSLMIGIGALVVAGWLISAYEALGKHALLAGIIACSVVYSIALIFFFRAMPHYVILNAFGIYLVLNYFLTK